MKPLCSLEKIRSQSGATDNLDVDNDTDSPAIGYCAEAVGCLEAPYRTHTAEMGGREWVGRGLPPTLMRVRPDHLR